MIIADIFSAFTQFADKFGIFLDNVSTFFYNFFNDLVYVIGLLTRMVGDLPNYFTWLPAGVVSILLAIFSIVIIYQILGRE